MTSVPDFAIGNSSDARPNGMSPLGAQSAATREEGQLCRTRIRVHGSPTSQRRSRQGFRSTWSSLHSTTHCNAAASNARTQYSPRPTEATVGSPLGSGGPPTTGICRLSNGAWAWMGSRCGATGTSISAWMATALPPRSSGDPARSMRTSSPVSSLRWSTSTTASSHPLGPGVGRANSGSPARCALPGGPR